jgi:hypothetical protein
MTGYIGLYLQLNRSSKAPTTLAFLVNVRVSSDDIGDMVAASGYGVEGMSDFAPESGTRL